MSISASEVLFSYRPADNSSLYHVVKGNYVQSSGSSFSLNEEYHLLYNVWCRCEAFSLSENSETIWHVAILSDRAVYFQYNSTNLSLIGNKYSSTVYIGVNSLNIVEAGGIV